MIKHDVFPSNFTIIIISLRHLQKRRRRWIFPFQPSAISAKRFNLPREISQGTEILSKVSAPLCLPMIKGECLKTQVMENPLPFPILHPTQLSKASHDITKFLLGIAKHWRGKNKTGKQLFRLMCD
jgi:hypothetical protein